jgi:hypothetical protein
MISLQASGGSYEAGLNRGGAISDDDSEWVGGQKDKLIGLVQKKYGYSRDQAQEKVNRRFDQYDERTGSAAVADEFETAESCIKEKKINLKLWLQTLSRSFESTRFPSYLLESALVYCLLRNRHD